MERDLNIFIGENLKKAILKSKRSTTELTNHLGLAKNTIPNYCNGKLPDNIIQFLLLSQELGISIDYLLNGLENEIIPIELNINESDAIDILNSIKDEREQLMFLGEIKHLARSQYLK